MWYLSPIKTSGSKQWTVLTADTDQELTNAARILREDIHDKGLQPRHLDIDEHKRRIAIRHGAREKDE